MLYEKHRGKPSLYEIPYGFKNLWDISVTKYNFAEKSFLASDITAISLNGELVSGGQLRYLFDYNRDGCTLSQSGGDGLYVTLTQYDNETGEYGFRVLVDQNIEINGILGISGDMVNNANPQWPIIEHDDKKLDRAQYDADLTAIGGALDELDSGKLDIARYDVDQTALNEKLDELENNAGDMRKDIYDTDNTGVVDNAERLGQQEPSYYTDAANINYTPSSVGTEAMPVSNALDALFAGSGGGIDDRITTVLQIINRVYEGVDLTVRFAAEIAAAPYNGDPWAWIQSRAQAGNFIGLNVGDYIPWVSKNGYTVKSEIAGMDTYFNCGDAPIPHHIDFISRDCWPDARMYNRANYNNGLFFNGYPWLVCDVKLWLNSELGLVPNATHADPEMLSVDYSVSGVYDKLPDALKAVIVPKSLPLPYRYEAGTELKFDMFFIWMDDICKLWIPSEAEVCGYDVRGSRGSSSGGYAQYPIFAQNAKRRIKGAGDGGRRSRWWLSTTGGGSSSSCASVHERGDINIYPTITEDVRVPVCFRIA